MCCTICTVLWLRIAKQVLSTISRLPKRPVSKRGVFQNTDGSEGIPYTGAYPTVCWHWPREHFCAHAEIKCVPAFDMFQSLKHLVWRHATKKPNVIVHGSQLPAVWTLKLGCQSWRSWFLWEWSRFQGGYHGRTLLTMRIPGRFYNILQPLDLTMTPQRAGKRMGSTASATAFWPGMTSSGTKYRAGYGPHASGNSLRTTFSSKNWRDLNWHAASIMLQQCFNNASTITTSSSAPLPHYHQNQETSAVW